VSLSYPKKKLLVSFPAPFRDMRWLLLCSKKTEIGREYNSGRKSNTYGET
jgi:hypothetical protein